LADKYIRMVRDYLPIDMTESIRDQLIDAVAALSRSTSTAHEIGACLLWASGDAHPL